MALDRGTIMVVPDFDEDDIDEPGKYLHLLHVANNLIFSRQIDTSM